MTDLTPTYHEEVSLMGYGESDSSGAWIKLEVDPDDLGRFRGLKKQRFACALVLLGEDGKPIPGSAESGPASAPAGESDRDGTRSQAPNGDAGLVTDSDSSAGPKGLTGGKFVRELLLSGVFNQLKVLECIGTDDEFRAWIRKQPSCISKQTPCEAAHVRRTGPENRPDTSGTSYKAKYSCVPLTKGEHNVQHNHGEAACLSTCLEKGTYDWKPQEAKDWFDKKAAWYRWEWATKHILAGFNNAADVREWNEVTSRKDIPVYVWREWFAERNITLPPQLA